MGISGIPTSYGCSETYLMVFVKCLAVVAVPILNLNLKPSLCPVSQCWHADTPSSASKGPCFVRILQGGITVRSVSHLKRDMERMESLQVFEPRGKEGGLRNLLKLRQSWNKRNVDLQLSFSSWMVTFSGKYFLH